MARVVKNESLPGDLIARVTWEGLWEEAAGHIARRPAGWLSTAMHVAVSKGLLTGSDAKAVKRFLTWSGAAGSPNHEQSMYLESSLP
eukprot:2614620-Amphidinium_carterae.1